MGFLSKSVRLTNLLQLLGRKKHYLTVSALTEQLGVTERTVFRDLADLEKLGFPIYYDRGYKIHSDVKIPQWVISETDLTTLQMLAESSPLLRLPSMQERWKIIQSKILSLLPVSSTTKPEDSPFQPDEFAAKTKWRFNTNLLERAINEQRVVMLNYLALEDHEPTLRKIHPYVIMIRNGQWYLIAFSPERNDYRFFRFERIYQLTVTDSRFKRNLSYDLKSFFEHSWSVFRGEPIQVKLRLTGKAARFASERQTPVGMKMTWGTPDSALLEVVVQGTQEILNWVLSMGPEAEILEPENLREEIKSRLTQSLNFYNEKSFDN